MGDCKPSQPSIRTGKVNRVCLAGVNAYRRICFLRDITVIDCNDSYHLYRVAGDTVRSHVTGDAP